MAAVAAARRVTCGDAVLLGRYVHGSPEWHAARATRLGGSEIAAVLGLSPYESEFSLWHRKAGLVSIDRDSNEMEAGRRLESVIVQKFQDTHPEWRVQTRAGTWVHKDRPWQLANPDGFVTVNKSRRVAKIHEAKFALYDDAWGEPGTDEVPVYYRCQVQWYLDVFGLPEAYLTVFIGSRARFDEYRIRANPDDQAALREAGLAFMERLWSGERPPIDGHEQTYEVVRELHPDIADYAVELDQETAAGYCGAKHAAAAAEVEARRWTAIVAERIGDGKSAKWMGRVVASRMSKKGGVPYVKAAAHLPVFTNENQEGLGAA